MDVERLALVNERSTVCGHVDECLLRYFPDSFVQSLQIIRYLLNVLKEDDYKEISQYLLIISIYPHLLTDLPVLIHYEQSACASLSRSIDLFQSSLSLNGS